MQQFLCGQPGHIPPKHHLSPRGRIQALRPPSQQDALQEILAALVLQILFYIYIYICVYIAFVQDMHPPARVVLLVYLAQAMGLAWFIEQPRSSTAVYHPRFRHLRHCFPESRMLIILLYRTYILEADQYKALSVRSEIQPRYSELAFG